MRFRVWLVLTALLISAVVSSSCLAKLAQRWSQEKANAWYAKKLWLIGCNFIPSTAINQLEMFQADTFDIETIDRELGWAEQLGFNSIRVYLHNLLWEQDSKGFVKRADKFLKVADRHNIGIGFVLLDACWDPFPKLGKQRDPKPHLHNSGWVQAPGAEILKDPARHDELRPYIVGFVKRFRSDKRIHFWDIFNEPDNVNRSSYFEHEPPPDRGRGLISPAARGRGFGAESVHARKLRYHHLPLLRRPRPHEAIRRTAQTLQPPDHLHRVYVPPRRPRTNLAIRKPEVRLLSCGCPISAGSPERPSPFTPGPPGRRPSPSGPALIWPSQRPKCAY